MIKANYQIDDVILYIGNDDNRRDAKVFLKPGLILGINEDGTYKVRLVCNDQFTYVLKHVPEQEMKLLLR